MNSQQTTDRRPQTADNNQGARQLVTTASCLLLTAFCLFPASGCAILGPIKHQVPSASSQRAEVLEDGYRDVTGVIHIHTVYSDGAGTIEEIARIANQEQLDYLIVTDHNTLKALRDGKQGWYSMTLVLIGTEISARAGHYLALNVHEEINRNQPTQAIIDEVNRQGGLGFIAHPYFKKRRWTDWTVRGFTGIEGFNVAHEALDKNPLKLVLWSMTMSPASLYLSILERPYDPLAKWDEQIQQRGKVVGIGSSDAHEIRVLGLKIAPYEILFQLIRTHLLIPAGSPLAEQTIYDALRQGHAYFSVDLLTDAKGFTFMADDAKRVLGIMGDEVPLVPHLRLTAVLPAPAQLDLFKDGRRVASTTERVWHLPVTEPGTYRLEAFRDSKPWIFSNPIYVRADPKATDLAGGGKQ